MVTEEQQPMEPGAGNVGLTRRSHDRLYYNARRRHDIGYLVDRQVPWALQRIEQEDAGRVVGRYVLSEDELHEAFCLSSILRENIEAAVPVGRYDDAPLFMAMWALNRSDRKPLVSVELMCNDTARLDRQHVTPAERVESLRRSGFRFIRHCCELSPQDVHALWGPMFGWTENDIVGLSHRLDAQQGLSAAQRSVWFSAVCHGEELISLSIAERLNLPLWNRASLPIVESTEWCIRPGWEGRGLTAGCVSFLHAQVFTDLIGLEPPTVLIAETNFATRADRVGYAVGLRVPPRWFEGTFVPQVLRQNVAVGDGISGTPLRDFTMMYLPEENRETLYSPVMCRLMMEAAS